MSPRPIPPCPRVFAPTDDAPDYEPALDALRQQASASARLRNTVTSLSPEWQQRSALKAARLSLTQARDAARVDRYGR